MIKSMKFVGVPVSDQQRALDFYTTKLGFRVITDQPFDDHQRWIELGVGRNGTGIALFTPDEHKDRIGHYHTGGVPGRNEIDDTQELNYTAVCKAIAETGFQGYVSQEFVPRWDPMTSLEEAIAICDV